MLGFGFFTVHSCFPFKSLNIQHVKEIKPDSCSAITSYQSARAISNILPILLINHYQNSAVIAQNSKQIECLDSEITNYFPFNSWNNNIT